MKGPSNQTVTNRTEVDPATRARQDVLWNTAYQALGGTVPEGGSSGGALWDRAVRSRMGGGGGAPTMPALDPSVLQYNPYTGERFATPNQDMTDSWQMARNAADAGTGAVTRGEEVFRDLAGFQPRTVTPGLMDSYTADMTGIGTTPSAVSPTAVSARDVTSKNFTDYDISKYMNPFIGSVVDASLSDLDRSRQGMIQQGQAAAAKAGAYGGSRHGVADSLTNEAALREAAMASANLRKAGFDTAAGLITGDANRDLAAQQGNQGKDVAVGTANAANALNAGIANNTFAQNRDALFADISKFNAAQKQSASQFNTGLDFQGQTANQNADVAGAGVRTSAASGLVNTGATQQAMAGKGADLLNRIGLQRYGLDQQQKDFDFQQWQMGQHPDPYGKLNWLSGFTGTPAMSSTTTTPMHTNPLGQLAGAAATVLPFLL